MNISNFDPVYVIFGMICFIISGSIHEFSHALAAYKLGDNTAKMNGRLTLNPLAHMDIIGTVFFPLIASVAGAPVIGWMKPVPVYTANFENPSRDHAIVAFAGPFSNLLQACFAVIVIKLSVSLLLVSGSVNNTIFTYIWRFLNIYFLVNICLMVFNLLPVPPLDGGWIFRHFIPDSFKEKFDIVYRYGFILLYVLVLTGILEYIFTPFISIYNRIMMHIANTNLFILSLPFLLLSGIVGIFLKEDIKRVIYKIKHNNKLKVLSSTNNIKGDDDKNINVPESEEINNSPELNDSASSSKLCDGTIFKKENKSCIKCDRYIKCLVKSLKKEASP